MSFVSYKRASERAALALEKSGDYSELLMMRATPYPQHRPCFVMTASLYRHGAQEKDWSDDWGWISCVTMATTVSYTLFIFLSACLLFVWRYFVLRIVVLGNLEGHAMLSRGLGLPSSRICITIPYPTSLVYLSIRSVVIV